MYTNPNSNSYANPLNFKVDFKQEMGTPIDFKLSELRVEVKGPQKVEGGIEIDSDGKVLIRVKPTVRGDFTVMALLILSFTLTLDPTPVISRSHFHPTLILSLSPRTFTFALIVALILGLSF